MFPGKLRSKWSRPYVVVTVMPHRAVELRDEATDQTFLVNVQRVKHYYGENMSQDEEAMDLVNDE